MMILVFLGAFARGEAGVPPGAEPYPPELIRQIEKARESKGPDYQPRTRHLAEDGRARFTNRLILTSSPYLLQHAHNPVNWYSWGDEAFETARRLGRPVMLSVGYSTCHWCHVMEEESFEDLEIARFMNENYITIKVDREERPDIDSIYMSAVQALKGSGGWPMTVWLTPDRQPYYGATYIPPRDGDRGARVGFLTMLRRLKQAYDEEPDKVAGSAADLTNAIKARLTPTAGTAAIAAEILKVAVDYYKESFDAANGGVTRRRKFPSSLPVRMLLRYHRRTGDERSLEMATVTLRKMAAGGLYDQVGGGFHRYTVDPEWLVPHFEKMLYDNALLVSAYLEGYQVTGDEELARIARETLRYVERDMTSPEGAFYSATDADSLAPGGHREEGYFFTWTPAELVEALGEEKARILSTVYGVTEEGNFEGRNILHLPDERVPAKLRKDIDEAREILYRKRGERPAPLRDEKILTAWNGLMISAFAQAALVLDEEGHARTAARAADFLLHKLKHDGRLLRSYKDGQASHRAYLQDYAFLIAGLLDLFEVTSERRWLEETVALDRMLEKHYEDKESGGFFLTSDDHEKLLAREKPGNDGAVPSGNSIASLNLLRLHEFTTEDRYRQRAEKTMKAADLLARAPMAVSEMLLAVDFHTDSPKEVVIVTRGQTKQAEPFLDRLRGVFLPNRVVSVAAEGKHLESLSEIVPLLKGKVARDGEATAYVCKRGVCDLPTTDPDVFEKQIREAPPAKP
jgi:uncharacterized protein YyaL (SSP411 family)